MALAECLTQCKYCGQQDPKRLRSVKDTSLVFCDEHESSAKRDLDAQSVGITFQFLWTYKVVLDEVLNVPPETAVDFDFLSNIPHVFELTLFADSSRSAFRQVEAIVKNLPYANNARRITLTGTSDPKGLS